MQISFAEWMCALSARAQLVFLVPMCARYQPRRYVCSLVASLMDSLSLLCIKLFVS